MVKCLYYELVGKKKTTLKRGFFVLKKYLILTARTFSSKQKPHAFC